MRGQFLCLLASLLLWGTTLPAAEPVALEISLGAEAAADKPVLAGQKCPITVNLLTATTFSSAVAFDLPTVPGGVLMQFGDRPALGTKKDGETSYTVQTYDLAFFALRPGSYAIPPFTVRFSSPETFGGKPVDRTLTTKPLSVTSKAPPGAESLPGIVCAQAFHVEETWTPDRPKTLHVGDSLTRRITSTAGDVPAMVFPPIPVLQAAGLKAYPQPPVAEDQIERGDLTGKRIDTTTYICQEPGRVLLPELVIPWWSLTDNSLQEIRLPAVTFEILPSPSTHGPAVGTGPSAVTSPRSGTLWFVTGTSILLASAATILFVKWNHLREGSPRSIEAARFHELIVACRENKPQRVHDALFRWTASRVTGPIATCEDLAAEDRALTAPLADLERAVATGCAWNGGALANALRHHRGGGRLAAVSRPVALPPLNP